MTDEEMSSLCDIFQTLDPDRKTKQAKYVLQLLWRDLSSKFDLLGSYYTSETGFDAKFMMTAIHESMLKLHWFGFHTAAIVLDGACSNLTMIKIWSEGKKEAYGIRADAEDKHAVKPWFIDSYNGKKVYFVICPSHMVCIDM